MFYHLVSGLLAGVVLTIALTTRHQRRGCRRLAMGCALLAVLPLGPALPGSRRGAFRVDPDSVTAELVGIALTAAACACIAVAISRSRLQSAILVLALGVIGTALTYLQGFLVLALLPAALMLVIAGACAALENTRSSWDWLVGPAPLPHPLPPEGAYREPQHARSCGCSYGPDHAPAAGDPALPRS